MSELAEQPAIPEAPTPLELAEARIKQIDEENAKMVEGIYTMLRHFEIMDGTITGRDVGDYIREHLLFG